MGETGRQIEAEPLPGLYRGSHTFSSTLDNGGAVARLPLSRVRVSLGQDLRGRGLDGRTDGRSS